MLALQRPGNSGACYLLPIAPGLLIPHQEVLIVDAREVKVKFASVQAAGPDQTRVTERSIGDDNRQTVQSIIHNMVISHFANRVGATLSPQRDSDYHVARFE